MKRIFSIKSQKLIVLGHIIECFDNTVYGFLAVMLAPLFFPTSSSQATILASYGAFAAGFLARPLGAFVFGHFGDTMGRKNTLVYSMALISIPTFIIGILPTYNTIGFIAPFILILCRLSQGFLIGGEFAGANLYISENSEPENIGKGTGVLISSGVMGAILATLVGGLVTLEGMPEWSWRLPFIGGGLSAFLIYLARKKMPETLAFHRAKQANEITKLPLKVIVKNYKKYIVLGSFIAGLTVIPLYCATVLGNKFFRELGYTTFECMMFNTFGMLIDALFVFYSGYLADRLGFQRLIKIGITSIMSVSFLSFLPFLDQDPSLISTLWFVFSLITVGCIINGCAMPYIASYFPTHCRFSGTALSVTLGQALFGGTTPILGAYLTDYFDSKFAPAYWVVGVAFITLVLLSVIKKPHYE